MNRVKARGQCECTSALAFVCRNYSLDGDIIACLGGEGKMIKLETKDEELKCCMRGNRADLFMESIAAVRALYDVMTKDPELQENFLTVLHNDLFLDAFDPLVSNVKFYEKEENEAEEFLRKFTDALKR